MGKQHVSLEEVLEEIIEVHGVPAIMGYLKNRKVQPLDDRCPPGYIPDGKGGCVLDPLGNP